jgi:phosphoribosylaminoimidazolecarboxamide formyltransferase/IMP cyclohydrolase
MPWPADWQRTSHHSYSFMSRIQRALISVSDKTGIVELARTLQDLGISILSTGGTAGLLAQSGIAVREVSDYTGFPEMLDGRVKTLHPKIHAGILARRDMGSHMASVGREDIDLIDLVIVNLYPFGAAVARPGCTLEEAIENIDVGGPAMMRAAAKNHAYVAVVTDPADYKPLIAELKANDKTLSAQTRFKLATKAFAYTSQYDSAIAAYFKQVDKNKETFPEHLFLQFERVQTLRYGENPHQSGAFYRDMQPVAGSISQYTQLQGKELSYNNIADADAAWELVKGFPEPACVIVKHANPCGVATGKTLLNCYRRAFDCDPASAFGGIIAFNRKLDAQTAQAATRQFLEVLIAPDIEAGARKALQAKANVRVLTVPMKPAANPLDFKRVGGGLLVQTPDQAGLSAKDLKVVTKKKPTKKQLADMLFAWRVVKFVKSNAIVFAANGQTLGIGAGQMSRVDSVRIAGIKAKNAKLSLKNCAVASEAFFPFRDSVDLVARAGASAIIQPGGSVRDEEVIAAANARGMAMVFTGLRHFRH